MANLFGMVGTGDFSTARTIGNWREGIVMIEPNGEADLLGITTMAQRAEPMMGTLHTWFERLRENDVAAITATYTDAALSSAYTPGAGTAGQVLYVKMAEADSDNFRENDRVVFRVGEDLSQDENGTVAGVEKNGTSSYVAVKLVSADGSTDAFTYLNIIGSRHPQGGAQTSALAYTPREFTTRPQIFKELVSMTRTAMTISKRRGLRTGEAWSQDHDNALRRWGARVDRAAIWEVLSSGTGANKQPEMTMTGIREFLTTYGPSEDSNHIWNAKTDSDYAGKEWLEYGTDWLNKIIKLLYRYAGGWGEVLCLCGDEMLASVEQLAIANGEFRLEEAQAGYGIATKRWITNNGTVYLKSYAQFNQNPTLRRVGVWLFPRAMRYLYVDDVDLEENVQVPGTDGRSDQWVGECCFEFASPYLFGITYQAGVANTAS